MGSKKMSVTIDLANDEQLNQEIDALIRARVISITRSECDIAIDHIVKEEATRILQDRLQKISTEDQVNQIARQVVKKHLETFQGVRVIRDAVYEAVDSDSVKQRINDVVFDVLSNQIKNSVYKKLDYIIQADVIQCIVDAMSKKVKEG